LLLGYGLEEEFLTIMRRTWSDVILVGVLLAVAWDGAGSSSRAGSGDRPGLAAKPGGARSAGRGAPCLASRERWDSTPFPEQTGTFTVEFEAIPADAPINAITGLSFGRAKEYDDLAAAVRFSPEGVIDARKGSRFAARVSIRYKAGRHYHVRMVVRMDQRTYDVYVTPEGGAEQMLALNHGFRTEQDDLDALNHWAVFARDGSHEVCDFSERAEVAGHEAPVEERPAPREAPPEEAPPEPLPPPAAGATAVLVGAGDIGNCNTSTDEATAKLLDGIEGTVFTVGDNAYPAGSGKDFARCFEPTWGRHRDRMRPSPGNHDYITKGAEGYFDYFGARAGPPGRGYYSYNVGAWHVVSLNSNIDMSADSPQVRWLRGDLAASRARCTLAYWHHPQFSSGEHGNNAKPRALWDALYEAGAEVVVVGHDHDYERFAPQTPEGRADPAGGIRQFVVGTGGTKLRGIEKRAANSEVRNSGTHGVLKLTLSPDGYRWEFVPVDGESFTDEGTGRCH
jgi:hypothetical protein